MPSNGWQFKLNSQLSTDIKEQSWRLCYLSSPPLGILYFSRNSACFCRRISVCFLKPLILGNSTETWFKASTYLYLKNVSIVDQLLSQTREIKSIWRHKPGPLFGFIVYFCDDSVFLIHEVIVNFFKFPETIEHTKVRTLNWLTSQRSEGSLYNQLYCFVCLRGLHSC